MFQKLAAAALGLAIASTATAHDGAATLLADLRKVYLYETRADLYFESPVGGTAVPMVQEDGAWKLGE
jgi:hypothetical protein